MSGWIAEKRQIWDPLRRNQIPPSIEALRKFSEKTGRGYLSCIKWGSQSLLMAHGIKIDGLLVF